MNGLHLQRVESAIEKSLSVLGLTEETSRLVTIFPLLYLAWADKNLAEPEGQKILEAAGDAGLTQGATGAVLLRWLDHEPAPEFWTHGLYLVTVLLGPDRRIDREHLLELCEEVGRATGGLFGVLFTLSTEERHAIERVAAALKLGGAALSATAAPGV